MTVGLFEPIEPDVKVGKKDPVGVPIIKPVPSGLKVTSKLLPGAKFTLLAKGLVSVPNLRDPPVKVIALADSTEIDAAAPVAIPAIKFEIFSKLAYFLNQSSAASQLRIRIVKLVQMGEIR